MGSRHYALRVEFRTLHLVDGAVRCSPSSKPQGEVCGGGLPGHASGWVAPRAEDQPKRLAVKALHVIPKGTSSQCLRRPKCCKEGVVKWV